MKTIDKVIDGTKFDWNSYYKKVKASLKKDLEEKPEMWNNWTKFDKRYMLVCYFMIVENSVEDNLSGKVTGHLDCHISSDNIEDLRLFWKSAFIQRRYDNTRQHFIADMKEKKIIEFVSVCM